MEAFENGPLSLCSGALTPGLPVHLRDNTWGVPTGVGLKDGRYTVLGVQGDLAHVG